MALFQLDPQSIAARVQMSGAPARLPTLTASIVRGAIGFSAVSLAGFAPWPIFDRWFPGSGEVGLYVACTALFIGASGIFLHRLILGAGSLPRFYKLFTLAFAAYAICWVALWTRFRDDAGVIGGLLAGTAAMGALLAWAFDAWRSAAKIIAVLFALHALGYTAGSGIAGRLMIEHRLAAILLWAACYGLGLGAGLGAAFHLCQSEARRLAAMAGALRGALPSPP